MVYDESAVVLNMKKTRGDTWKFLVTFTQGGAPMDISAWEFSYKVLHPRTLIVMPGLDLSLGTGLEFTVNPGELEGTVQTDSLTCNSYPHFLRFERPDDYIRTPFSGLLIIASL